MEDRMDCFSYNTAILLGKEKCSKLVGMGYKKGEAFQMRPADFYVC